MFKDYKIQIKSKILNNIDKLPVPQQALWHDRFNFIVDYEEDSMSSLIVFYKSLLDVLFARECNYQNTNDATFSDVSSEEFSDSQPSDETDSLLSANSSDIVSDFVDDKASIIRVISTAIELYVNSLAQALKDLVDFNYNQNLSSNLSVTAFSDRHFIVEVIQTPDNRMINRDVILNDAIKLRSNSMLNRDVIINDAIKLRRNSMHQQCYANALNEIFSNLRIEEFYFNDETPEKCRFVGLCYDQLVYKTMKNSLSYYYEAQEGLMRVQKDGPLIHSVKFSKFE